MSNCTICGGITLSGKTCVLCSYGRFPDETPKDAAKARGVRHNPPLPGIYPELWLEVLSRERISDLFRTLPGLAGHWTTVQNEINSTHKAAFFVLNGATTQLGRTIYRAIANAIINAADDAGFDFPLQTLVFAPDVARLKIHRTNGHLEVESRP